MSVGARRRARRRTAARTPTTRRCRAWSSRAQRALGFGVFVRRPRSPSSTSCCRRSPAGPRRVDPQPRATASRGWLVVALLLRVPVLRRLRRPVPHASSCAAATRIGWRASYEITMAGRGRHAPVRGRRRRRHRAHGVGAAALGDGAPAWSPTGWSPSSSCSTSSTWARSSSSGSGSTSASSTARRRSRSRSCRRSSACCSIAIFLAMSLLPGDAERRIAQWSGGRGGAARASGARSSTIPASVAAGVRDGDRPRARRASGASSARSPGGASTSRPCGRAFTPSAPIRRRSR